MRNPRGKRLSDRPVCQAQAVVLRACCGQTADGGGAAGPRRGPPSCAGAAGGAAGPRTHRSESRPRPLLLCCDRARAGPRSPLTPRRGPTAASAVAGFEFCPIKVPSRGRSGLKRTRHVPRKSAKHFVLTLAGTRCTTVGCAAPHTEGGCARLRFPFPLGPLLVRQTIRTEVERGTLWIFEQEQSLANSTSTNVRMTAIRLASGGIWIHAPIAPTRRAALLRPRSLKAMSSALVQHAAGQPSQPASVGDRGVKGSCCAGRLVCHGTSRGCSQQACDAAFHMHVLLPCGTEKIKRCCLRCMTRAGAARAQGVRGAGARAAGPRGAHRAAHICGGAQAVCGAVLAGVSEGGCAWCAPVSAPLSGVEAAGLHAAGVHVGHFRS